MTYLPCFYLTPTIRVTPITAQYPLFDHTSDALKSHTPYLESLHTLISPQSFPGHASLPTHSKSLSQKCTQHPPPFCFPSVLPNSFARGPSLEPYHYLLPLYAWTAVCGSENPNLEAWFCCPLLVSAGQDLQQLDQLVLVHGQPSLSHSPGIPLSSLILPYLTHSRQPCLLLYQTCNSSTSHLLHQSTSLLLKPA